jgi:hypothetical protein
MFSPSRPVLRDWASRTESVTSLRSSTTILGGSRPCRRVGSRQPMPILLVPCCLEEASFNVLPLCRGHAKRGRRSRTAGWASGRNAPPLTTALPISATRTPLLPQQSASRWKKPLLLASPFELPNPRGSRIFRALGYRSRLLGFGLMNLTEIDLSDDVESVLSRALESAIREMS